jgi:hypothetical protein
MSIVSQSAPDTSLHFPFGMDQITIVLGELGSIYWLSCHESTDSKADSVCNPGQSTTCLLFIAFCTLNNGFYISILTRLMVCCRGPRVASDVPSIERSGEADRQRHTAVQDLSHSCPAMHEHV